MGNCRKYTILAALPMAEASLSACPLVIQGKAGANFLRGEVWVGEESLF